MNKKLRVGIDARMISHSGIGTYLSHLLRELPANRPSSLEFVLFGSPRAFKDLNGSYACRDFKNPIYSLSEQFGFLNRTSSVDLWHSPHYNVPLFCFSDLVVTVHDLIPLIFSGRFFSQLQKNYFVTLLKRISVRARRIIAVSQNTKNDIIRFFGVPENQIRVIYEGVSSDFHPFKDPSLFDTVRKRYGIPVADRFILYVGLLKPHKNLRILIQTVRRLRREGKIAEKLLMIGTKSKNGTPEEKYLSEISSDQDLLHIDRVGGSDLPIFYNMASVFVLPSLYEGFGLPVLEAFACGTPVIISNRASLPEIAGDAALSFEADSEENLAETILKITQNAKLGDELRERGIRRAREFSWTKMARETVKVYEEVLTNL